MALRNVKAFGNQFDIEISRNKDKIQVQLFLKAKVLYSKTIANGESLNVSLK